MVSMTTCLTLIGRNCWCAKPIFISGVFSCSTGSSINITLSRDSPTLPAYNGVIATIENLIKELDTINIRLEVNKLSLNVAKTKTMVFHVPQ